MGCTTVGFQPGNIVDLIWVDKARLHGVVLPRTHPVLAHFSLDTIRIVFRLDRKIIGSLPV